MGVHAGTMNAGHVNIHMCRRQAGLRLCSRRLSSAQLLSALALVLAGHDQGGVPGAREHCRGI